MTCSSRKKKKHHYWYFNGDFTTSPAFDRLELMEKVHEAYYEMRNSFS